MKPIDRLIPIEKGKKALAFLQNANLEEVDFSEIKLQTDILVRCGFAGGELNPLTHWIFRGVVVDVNEIPLIRKVGRISYRNKKTNDLFRLNRASSSKYQIFYGGIPTPDFDDGKIASVLEVDNIRDDNFPEDEYEYIAMGLWFIKKTFFVASVGMHSKIAENSKWANNIAIYDKKIYQQAHDAGLINEILQFVGGEFGKWVPKGKEYLYKISAAYGDSLFDLGVDGIMFPSVQTSAKSFNIALRSELIDNQFVDIEAAAVIRGSKIKKEIFWGWFLQCPRVFGSDLKWEEPPAVSQISQNDLDQFRKLINNDGKFPVQPRIVV